MKSNKNFLEELADILSNIGTVLISLVVLAFIIFVIVIFFNAI